MKCHADLDCRSVDFLIGGCRVQAFPPILVGTYCVHDCQEIDQCIFHSLYSFLLHNVTMLLEDAPCYLHGPLGLLAMLLSREDRIMAERDNRMPSHFESKETGDLISDDTPATSTSAITASSQQATTYFSTQDQESDDAPDTSTDSQRIKMKTARPYRSHKYPACTRCHKRRSRCTIETPGSACLLCRMHGVPCSSESVKRDDRSTPRVGFIHRSLLPDNTHMNNMTHVVGPVIARDTQIMDNYLVPNVDNNISSKPIYHVPIPPRRPSPAAQCSCSRNLPLELLDQVDSFFEKLAGMYFEHLYPAFPVLDEEIFVSQLSDRQSISKILQANFTAYVLYYWNMAPELMLHARPDQDFAWQVAYQAIASATQQSDMSTIIAIVLNVAGRPSKAFIANMMNTSRLVALAHSCGLNHDCSDWKIADSQKRLRWKTWWAILIHDRWLNFAQGTPPYINSAHYDVPKPTIELLAFDRIGVVKHYRAAECYIELCKLTEIIGDVLPLMYHIRSGQNDKAAEQTSRSDIDLARWHAGRPKWIDYSNFDTRPAIPGLVNLQLSYFAVRMLLRRLAWHETDPSQSAQWLEACLDAAENIVRLVVSLKPLDLAGFWLPYNAHHFTSAVTLLLRCALQTEDLAIRRQSMASARRLVDQLRKFRDEQGWDLAETALSQSETVLKRIEDALPGRTPVAQVQMQMNQPSPGVDDSFWDNPMLQYPGFGWPGQPEEIFPGVFGELNADSMLFDTLG